MNQLKQLITSAVRNCAAGLLGLAGAAALAQDAHCPLPPIANQEANRIGLIVQDNHPTSFLTAHLSNVPQGFALTNGAYMGWCVDYWTLINPGELYQPLVYHSYDPNLPAALQHPNWDMLNYIVNHKQGDAIDVQAAIWHFMGGPVPTDDPIWGTLRPAGQAMIDDATANGEGFVPGPTEVSLVIAEVGPGVQRNVFEISCPPIIQPQCYFNDFVWNDMNVNGFRDAGEPGIPNVQVKLMDCNGNVVTTTTTDVNGSYSFAITGVLPSTFRINLTAPEGYAYISTGAGAPTNSGSTACFTMSSDCTVTKPPGDGFFVPALVGDRVWEDLNRNGIQDNGEPGIGGVLVQLFNQDNSLVSSTNTDVNGLYVFTRLPATNYFIKFTPPMGYYISPRDQGGDLADSDIDSGGATELFTLVAGQEDLSRDAGLFRLGAIGDFVWEDRNENGIQDGGEVGIPNVLVTLINCADQSIVATTMTAANGFYGFINLTPGSYKVSFSKPTGFQFTTANVGNDMLDSDVDPATGMTQCITIMSGTVNLTIDAGLIGRGAIGDRVWYDANANGLQDAGEVGVANVTVKLLDCSGNILASAVTSASGNYLFSNLKAGNYKVRFFPPAGTGITYKDVGSDEAIDSDPDRVTGITDCITLAAGETNLKVDGGGFRVGSIGDYVWLDANCNGIQDSTEKGIANVRVELMNCGGSVIASTLTASTGKYLFTNMPAGSYQVRFIAPAGQSFTSKDLGSNDAVDSDADSTGLTACFTLAEGEAKTTIDAGLKKRLAFTTYTQGGWGAKPSGNNPASLLAAKFPTLYKSGAVIGGTYTIKCTTAYAVQIALPMGGTPGILKKSYTDPTVNTEAGVFPGQVMALKFNVDFSNAGYTTKGLGNLKIAPGNKLAGSTVTSVLALANKVLGGSTSSLPSGCSVADLSNLVDRINNNFDNGTQDLGLLNP